MKRQISDIASDIYSAWPNVYFGAKPYLSAMLSLSTVNDNYGMDSARSIINYFLGNASTFRGEEAKRLKNELKDLMK